MNPLRSLARSIGHAYSRHACRREWASQKFRYVNERPIEYAFLLQAVARYCPHTVLDIGTGQTAQPALLSTCGCVVTAIDDIDGYWPRGMFNRHFHILKDDIRACRLQKQFDLVACISVLEHIPEHDAAVRSMRRLLRKGGHLVLTVPYNEDQFVPNVYACRDAGYGQGANYICQVFSEHELHGWLKGAGFALAEQEFWRVFSGELWTFGTRLVPAVKAARNEDYQLTCLLLEAS